MRFSELCKPALHVKITDRPPNSTIIVSRIGRKPAVGADLEVFGQALDNKLGVLAQADESLMCSQSARVE